MTLAPLDPFAGWSVERREGFEAGIAAFQAELQRLHPKLIEQACEPWKHCSGEPPPWDSPLMNVWQAAICWTLDIVGGALGAETWERGDGSETLDGDVAAEVTHIMRAAGLVNKDGDTITKADLATLTTGE